METDRSSDVDRLADGHLFRDRVRNRHFVLAIHRKISVQASEDSPEQCGLRAAQNESTGAETVRALKELVANLLPDARPTIERLASRLGLSTRTLQRRLRALDNLLKAHN